MSRLLTAQEHETLSIGPGARDLTPMDVDALVQLGRDRPGFCTLGHRSVRFAQYAGLVNLGGRILEILPKVDDGAAESTGRATFLRLLHAARRVPIHVAGSVGHSLEKRSLLSVFIAAFLSDLALVVRGGLLRRYVSRAEDRRVVRGRLLASRQIAVHGGRPDLLVCRYEDLSIDNARNQLLRAALLTVRPWIVDLDDGRRWLEFNAAFDGIALPRDPIALLDGLSHDRQTRRYEAAIRWAGIILRLLSPSVRAGSQEAPAMLFDMNRLFEVAVANEFATRVRAAGLVLTAQHKGSSLDETPGSPAFSLRPDIVLSAGERVVAVADTKWTHIERGIATRLRPDEAHVYQMNAYASAFDCQDFYLLYPWHSDIAGGESVFQLKRRDGPPNRLHVVCVDVMAEGFPIRHGQEFQWPLGNPSDSSDERAAGNQQGEVSDA